MVAISGQYTMYMGGNDQDAAFVDVRCFKKTDPGARRAFTGAVFEILQEIAGFPPERVCLNFTDHDVWGAREQLREEASASAMRKRRGGRKQDNKAYIPCVLFLTENRPLKRMI